MHDMPLDFPASPSNGQKFPASPIAGVPQYTWDGEKWTTIGGSIVSATPGTALPLMDAKPALVGVSTNFSREDHVHPSDTSRAAFDAMAYSGMQINSAMEVSQENGSNAVSVSATAKYIIDGWQLQSTGTQVMNAVQGAGGPPGFLNYLAVTPTTANAAPAAGHQVILIHRIEGWRVGRLMWGTAAAQPITISFWVSAVRPGNYSGSILNAAGNRSYPFTFTINAASTWEYKTVTIPGDTAGTWAKDNTIGLQIFIAMMAGTTFQGPANAWAAGTFFGVTGTINGVAATSDALQITGVTVFPGSEAPSAARSPFVMRPFDQELTLCKRYYRRLTGPSSVIIEGYVTAGIPMAITIPLEPTMRAIPTTAIFGTFTNTNVLASNFYPGPSSLGWEITPNAAGSVVYYAQANSGISLDARL
jgi:hypothetical protein